MPLELGKEHVLPLSRLCAWWKCAGVGAEMDSETKQDKTMRETALMDNIMDSILCFLFWIFS